MAEFKLMGRFIALSDEKVIPATEAGKNPMRKREIYMDCTRMDYYTRQPIGKENKVLLEFGGDQLLTKVVALNLQKDDVIAVDFGIVGAPYTDKNGKRRVFTSIRCYDVEVLSRAGQAPAAPQPQPVAQPVQTAQPAPAPAAQPQETQPQSDGGQDDDGLPF